MGDYVSPADMKAPRAFKWTRGECPSLCIAPWVNTEYEKVELGASLAPTAYPSDVAYQCAEQVLHLCYSDLVFTRLPWATGLRTTHESIQGFSGGTCVVWGEYACRKLAERGVTGIMIPSSLPPRYRRPWVHERQLAHVAIIIPCATHAVLLDPTLDFPNPVLVPWCGTGVWYDHPANAQRYFLVYDRDASRINCYECCADGSDHLAFRVFYQVQPIKNPWQAITCPMNDAQDTISIVRWSVQGKKLLHIMLRLDTMTFEKSAIAENFEKQPLRHAALHLDSILTQRDCEQFGFNGTAQQLSLRRSLQELLEAALLL